MRVPAVVLTLVAVAVVVGAVGVAEAQDDVYVSNTESGEVVGNPDVEVVVSEGVLTPGEENVVEFYVLNDGRIRRSGPPEYVERVTTARATTVEFTSRSDDVEIVTDEVAVGDVPPGATGPFKLRLDVDEDIGSGRHSLSAWFEYDYTRVVKYGDTSRMSDLSRDERQRVSLRVRRDARFDISARTNAHIGENGDATVTLRNTGDETAGDATVTATSGDSSLSFDGAPNGSVSAGDVPPGATVDVELPVSFSRDTNVRPHPLDVRVGYEDRRGVERVARGSASVIPAEEQRFGLRDVEARLRAGSVGSVSGEVVNLGGDAEDVVLRSVGETFKVRGDGVALGRMDGNETRNFSLRVESPVGTVSDVPFVLEPTYTRDGDTYTADELRFEAPVAETRDALNVRAVDGKTQVVPGGETDVVFDLTNHLDEGVRNVSVVAASDEPVEIEYTEAFVGTVDANGSAEVVFGVDADSDATQRSYPVSFRVRYTDSAGETLTTTSVARLDVVEEEGAVPFEDTLLIGVVVALLAGLGWWVYGKEMVGGR
ncbi:MAG: COG1361 S-layer family protein [Halobacteria archaeon]